ncbi:MAG: sulfatase-like hydrolase/transferase [Planctomycetaceae bacterium]
MFFKLHPLPMLIFLVPGLLGFANCANHSARADETFRTAAPRQRPNILFLLSDDQRPDTIAALGNPIIKTPHLDSLVKSGLTFTRATCSNPICTPSRAEILTGASGHRNGVTDFGGRFRKGIAFWANTFQRAGYRTGYVGKWHNAGRPSTVGYSETPGLYAGGGGRWAVPSFDWNGRPVTGYRGWIFQTDDRRTFFPERGVGLTPGISAHFADAAIQFLKKPNEKRPFFLHVNFTAPHDPLLMPYGYEKLYNPQKIPLPGNFLPRHPFDHGNFMGRDERLWEWPRTRQAVREELAVYYSVITHMDAQIGRIINTLKANGQWKNTIVIFASDHGLAIGSHGLRGKQNMYEHTIGVPLIFSGPGIPQNRKTSAQCYLRDLFPTTCELANIPIPRSVNGRSLKPVIDGKATSLYPHIFGRFRNVQRMIRTDEWKLIYYPQAKRTQLFHLKTDPLEMKNLFNRKKHAAIQKELLKKLADWMRSVNDPVLQKLLAPTFSEAETSQRSFEKPIGNFLVRSIERARMVRICVP